LVVAVLSLSCVLGASMASAQMFSEHQIRVFLGKKRPCYAWAFATFTSNEVAFGQVFCIFDGVVGRGTIAEATGCMAAPYDVNDATYVQVRGGAPRVPGKCGKGSISLVMQFYSAKAVFADLVGGETLKKVVYGGAGGEWLRRAACESLGVVRSEVGCSPGAARERSPPGTDKSCKADKDCRPGFGCVFVSEVATGSCQRQK
jgi:hypothetical protein